MPVIPLPDHPLLESLIVGQFCAEHPAELVMGRAHGGAERVMVPPRSHELQPGRYPEAQAVAEHVGDGSC